MTFLNNKHRIQFKIKFMTFKMYIFHFLLFIFLLWLFHHHLVNRKLSRLQCYMLKCYIYNPLYSYGIKYNYILLSDINNKNQQCFNVKKAHFSTFHKLYDTLTDKIICFKSCFTYPLTISFLWLFYQLILVQYKL